MAMGMGAIMGKVYDAEYFRKVLIKQADRTDAVEAVGAGSSAGAGQGRNSVNTILQALIRANADWIDAVDGIVLKDKAVLVPYGLRVQYLHFVNAGAMVSVMAPAGGYGTANEIQVAMLGREDVVGASALLANTVTGYLAVVTVGGGASATRVSAEVARRICARCEDSREILWSYIQKQLTRSYEVQARVASHSVDQRVAAWIERAVDTLESDALPFSHAKISGLTGMRRPSVTTAIQALVDEGVVRQSHGRLDVLKLDQIRARAHADAAGT